jgi:hypothetical protein
MATPTAQATPVTKRRAFFTLLGEVHDELPKDAVEKAFAVDSSIKVSRAITVLRGATADVELLAKIVKACLPKYKFPKIVSEFIAD